MDTKRNGITYFMWTTGLQFALLSAGSLNIFKIKYTILLLFKYINVSLKLEFSEIRHNHKTTVT